MGFPVQIIQGEIHAAGVKGESGTQGEHEYEVYDQSFH